MALDGIAVSCIVKELNDKLTGGRIDKIYQPENDEINIFVRSKGENYKLLLTANASCPRIHLTAKQRNNPLTAPMFCMVLRKHLTGGRIISIEQPDFERVVYIKIESLNEMGDLTEKTLIIEIMGKHSNIILINDSGMILDSVKHISRIVSSVREVLPGIAFDKTPSQNKHNPLELTLELFCEIIGSSTQTAQKAVYSNFTGISPAAASEAVNRSGIVSGKLCTELSEQETTALYLAFDGLLIEANKNNINEAVLDEKGSPVDFAVYSMSLFDSPKKVRFETVSEMLDYFYAERDNTSRIGQKSQDLRKLIQLNIERCEKKRQVQEKTLEEIEGRNYLKLCGELLTSNIYLLKKGMPEFTTINFYEETAPEITITLNPNLTPSENAQAYFKKYNKQKRTYEALQLQIEQNDSELEYLEGVLSSLFSSSDEIDINEIRDELAEQGFIKKKSFAKKRKQEKGGSRKKESEPLKYMSSDGFEIYVGKNNKQNDALTFRFALPTDIWLHAKKIPGSHVIIKCGGRTVSDTAITEAAGLAAYYSKAKNGSGVPVDYTERKNVKKPNGSKPGFVIYETNRTAYVEPNLIR